MYGIASSSLLARFGFSERRSSPEPETRHVDRLRFISRSC